MTITEEDVLRYAEAKTCEGCLGWHKYCHAECCKTVQILVDPKKLEMGSKYLTIKPKPMGMDDIKYYRFRDVEYVRGLLRFKKERVVVIGKNVFYFWPCSRLDGNLCLDHPNNKPELCKALTLETAEEFDRFSLTDNCLFKYKEKGGSNNG